MSILAKTLDSKRVVEVEYPDIEGFIIKIAYVTREDMSKMLDRNQKIVFDKLTKQREKEIDNDTFLAEYAEKVIKGWKGLKFKHLHKFYPADISDFDAEAEIPYEPDNALILLQNSTDFNAFLTDVTGDVSVFNQEEKDKNTKN